MIHFFVLLAYARLVDPRTLLQLLLACRNVLLLACLSERFITSLSERFITSLSERFITSLSERFITSLSERFITSLSERFITSLSERYFRFRRFILLTSEKSDFYQLCQQEKQLKTMQMREA